MAKKQTGSMYVDSNSNYAAGIDIFCSILIFMGLGVFVWLGYHSLGEIEDVRISTLTHDGCKELFD
jgi:hypothetical protein